MIDDFKNYMQSLQATSLADFPSPFCVWKLNGRFIQFIIIDTYIQSNLASNFLHELNNHYPSLITIWQDQWLQKKDIIKARLRSLAGKNETIHARQTVVERLQKDQADQFLNTYHLQGSANAYYKFGLMHQSSLVCVATFSKSRTMYDAAVYYRSYELVRFATHEGITITGGLGKLLHHFTELVNAQHIMTYIDRDWSDGNSFIKLNFECREITPPLCFDVADLNKPRVRVDQQTTHSIFTAGNMKMVWESDYFKLHIKHASKK
jgi:hypothetical protein